VSRYAARVCQESGCPEATASGPSAWRCPTHQRLVKRSPSSKATSSAGWKNLRAQVLERDHYLCQLQLPGCEGAATHCHHVEAKAWGGEDALSNLEAACAHCNLSKAQR
jgi:5-methylcytosine-specific restriction endonuclease McrA